MAEGLAYLHEIEIIHADVKGANVLVSLDVQAMLGDFGLSKEMSDISGGTELVGGTYRWMSPERLCGEGRRRSFEDDVYAFGITIFEVLPGYCCSG